MRISESDVLQASAVVVAAPRYAGAIAYALGINIAVRYPWLIDAEVASAVALAVLEGWAIAYVFRAIRSLPPRSVHSKRLFAMITVLLLMLPVVGTPYMVGAGYGANVADVMPDVAIWLWKFVVNAVVPLCVASVGYASGASTKKQLAKSHEQVVVQTDDTNSTTPRGLPNRHQEIVHILTQGSTPVAQIAQKLGVHRNTVTNDLKALAAQGIVRKNGRGWMVASENNGEKDV